MSYDHKIIEEKWLKVFEEKKPFYCDVHDFSKPKFYALDMFPYPSAQGLHVGHPEGYTASDVISRMKRMQGYNVLHPIGWDAFGLPAEQYALKTGNPPLEFTKANIQNFIRQLKSLGFSFDWSKEISTCDPSYYRWTQWIFKQLYLAGLAKHVDMPVNWCEELGTVLANDEVIDGKSERGGYPVIRKNMKQWVLTTPAYAERLLEGLDDLDWPNSTKEIQRNWIGKSVGANVIFKVKDTDKTFTVFTTRADTLFGATYCVLAPEHELVDLIKSKEQAKLVDEYKKACASKSDLERTELNKEKTGVFTGAYAINPVNQKEIPIWISDYVLASYGSGAIMAVPAHDTRDYAFAKKFGLEIIPVLKGGDISIEAFTEDGIHINSGFLDGMNKSDAIETMCRWLKEHKCGEKKTTYKLRDWIFARQRYWGEPIPIVHYDDHDEALSDDELPLKLPKLDDYKPKVNGTSPLDNVPNWVNYENKLTHQKGKRETNTMPGSAASSWYFMRYIDPHNDKEFANYELLKHWLPVDLYLGGAEHAVGHLLYSRFWTNFLYDKGLSPVKEPFKRLVHQGMVLGENNEKMSKSRGNVVNPDDVVRDYGADSLRLFEMFAGPLEESFPWSTTGLAGARRFIERVHRLYTEPDFKARLSDTNSHELDFVYNATVKKVTEDYEHLAINTAIAQMMICINAFYKAKTLYRPYMEGFAKMFSCVCPFVGEEIYQELTGKDLIDYEPWPTYDEKALNKETVKIAISVNGKLRDTIEVDKDIDDEALKAQAFELENVKRHIDGKTIKRVIIVKGKIVNIVAI